MFKQKRSEWTADYSWVVDHLALKPQCELKRAKEQFKAAFDELLATGMMESFDWLPAKKVKFVAGPRLLEMHKRRIEAKDAWLSFQREKARADQLVIALPARTQKEKERQDAFDPLAAICAEFVVRGWKALATKALARGLTQDLLREETAKRGHRLPLD